MKGELFKIDSKLFTEGKMKKVNYALIKKLIFVIQNF